MRRRLPYLVLIVALVAIDLVTKDLAFTRLRGYDENPHAWRTIDVIPQFFQLTAARNPGVVFGILAGLGGWLTLLNVVIFLFVGHMFLRTPPGAWVRAGSLALILAGALGNLYDRLRFGWVRDFLDFYVGDWWPAARDALTSWRGHAHWPPFNVADACIVVGVLVLVVILWRTPDKAKET
jgi:signal peptidase II